ncbi:hypothetical protein GJ744_000094 [Endocarpon pusillum]|uniref:Uncharacterized protein n=1 Tax=Endocarpon pusillum TaxID=364733 RepID=A0A8H7AVJ6_9EURO|nr:hypothetical protein GJ744_000094 [Endocarpon pusillum]
MAVADESLCRPVLEKDIVHIVDKNNKMIAFIFASALQKIFPTGTVERVGETFDRWSNYQVMPKPDRRHALHRADFLPRHPGFDREEARTHTAPSHM